MIEIIIILKNIKKIIINLMIKKLEIKDMINIIKTFRIKKNIKKIIINLLKKKIQIKIMNKNIKIIINIKTIDRH